MRSLLPAVLLKLFGLRPSEAKPDPDFSSGFLNPALNGFFGSSPNNFFLVVLLLSVLSDLKELLFEAEPGADLEDRADFSDLSSRLFLLFLNGMIYF